MRTFLVPLSMTASVRGPRTRGRVECGRDSAHQYGSKDHTEGNTMKATILQYLRDNRGITAIEYGLIAGVLALGIMAAVGDVATQLKSTFENIKTELSKASTS